MPAIKSIMTNKDLKTGVVGELGTKAPARVATTTNITLSGLQTVNGVALVADDIVLVRAQTDTSENGVYIATTSAWARAVWFDSELDALPGTLIFAVEGSVNPNTLWQTVCADNPIVFGTSLITFNAFITTSSKNVDEITNAIESSGQTLSEVDLFQLAKSMAVYSGQGGIFCIDSSIVPNIYVVAQIAPLLAPPIETLRIGTTIVFRPGTNNTGACTLNPFSHGANSIKLEDGVTDPSPGELTTTRNVTVIWDGTVWRITGKSSEFLTNLTVNNKVTTLKNEVTIASGSVAYTGYNMALNGQGNVDDTLNNITGGSDGDRVLLKPNDNGIITINDNDTAAGNIHFLRNSSRTLEFAEDSVELIYKNNGWREVSSNTNLDFKNSKGTDGYTYLPNGLIIHWGEEVAFHDVFDNYTASIVFSNAFPTGLLSLQISVRAEVDGIYNNDISTASTGYSATGFTLMMGEHSAGTQSVKGTWLAIGY